MGSSSDPESLGTLDTLKDSSFLAHFELRGKLGEGGMGVVYEVYDRERNHKVALKTLRRFSADDLLRFKKEFRSLQDLEHPNLVGLGELYEASGQWFFTMELIEGLDLLEYVQWPTRTAFTRSKPHGDDDPTLPDSSAAGAVTRGTRIDYDEGRLRSCLVQLTQGLSALHAAGKIHRDVKPSNVRVTPSGRLVLLDFGLVTETVKLDSWSDDRLVGTVAYMAPEQALSKPVEPAADWYAMGVVLYEALTGELPFDGSLMEVLLHKQQRKPALPSSLRPGIPDDLNRLCMDLLAIEPGARPCAAEILARLGAESGTRDDALLSSSLTQAAPFVGRVAELSQLHQAFEDARAGAAVTLVTGDSGVGKSALVKRFTDEVTKNDESVIVLAGACFERELLPYKAFDGIIDKLSRYLSSLDAAFVAKQLPLQAALLGQAFPVLRLVHPIALAPEVRDVLDPQELRTRVFSALRELFARLAEQHRMVLVIDDLQWADGDSLALLREIARPPDSPRILLVATVRDRPPALDDHDTPRDPAVHAIPESIQRLGADVRHIRLGCLPHAEAQQLAGALLSQGSRSRRGRPDEDFAIAEEAQGHPLFLAELVRQTLLGSDVKKERLRLQDVLGARILELDSPARIMLHLLTIAAAPVAHQTAARAAGIELGESVRVVSALRVAHLARMTGTRRGDLIAPYHSRVREAALAQLDAETRVALHERMAIALDASGEPESEQLAFHWHGAGQLDKAATCALQAANHAHKTMAFEHEAQLYRFALDLRPWPDGDKRALQVKLGDALSNAGRGAEAVQSYREAAAGAAHAEVVVLKRRISEELMRAGYLDEGTLALKDVLSEVGIKLAATPLLALLMLLMRRLAVRLRGTRYRERDTSLIAPNRLALIDICHTCASTFGLTDIVQGADFQARNLLLSLRTGEPFRVARALLAESVYAAVAGGRETRSTRMLAAGSVVADRLSNPYLQGMVAGTEGMIANCKGQWQRAKAPLERAEEIFRSRCVGATWERDTAQQHLLWTLYYLGELKEFEFRRNLALQEARERGNLYLATGVQIGQMNQLWLFRDDPASARAELEEAMGRWTARGFHIQHFLSLYAHVRIDLYCGAGGDALRRITAAWAPFRASFLKRFQWTRIQSFELRAASALAASLSQNADRERLLQEAERDARRIARERMEWSEPMAQQFLAAVFDSRGDTEAALEALDRAVRGFEVAGMSLYAATARRRLGELKGGLEGRKTVSDADAYLLRQGITRPEKVTRMLAPGFGLPTEDTEHTEVK